MRDSGRWCGGRNRRRPTSCRGCWRRRCVGRRRGRSSRCAMSAPSQLRGLVASAARRRPADRDRAAAAGEERGAGDRGRGAGVRREPDLGQHPARRLRAFDRCRADDPGAARASRCLRRCRGSRSGPRGQSIAAAVEALGERMAVISERRGPVIGLSLLAWLVVLALVRWSARRPGGAARSARSRLLASASSTCRCSCWSARRSSRARGVEQAAGHASARRCWRR